MDRPTDPAERRARWERYAKRHLQDQLAASEGLKALGFDVDDDAMELDRNQLEAVVGAPGFPNDRDLLDESGLSVWYERLYRLSSSYVHFSLQLLRLMGRYR